MRILLSIALCCICTIFFPSDSRAQNRSNSTGTGGIHTIQGRIYGPSGVTFESQITVELQSTNFSTISALSDKNGGFYFRAIAPGNYTVVIDAGDHFEVEREYVTIDTEVQGGVTKMPSPKIITIPVQLRLKPAFREQNKVINAKLAGIPPASLDNYHEAQKAIANNDSAKAIVKLKAALELYPSFSLAWNDLGVLLQKDGHNKEAVEAFRSAVKYDSESAAANLNLGCALYNAKEYKDAEKFLVNALLANGASYRGHYYMGLTQIKLGNIDIAEQAFRKAVEVGKEKAAMSHYMLGGIYWSVKRYKDAADELEQYLKLEPNATDAKKTQESIAELRRKKSN